MPKIIIRSQQNRPSLQWKLLSILLFSVLYVSAISAQKNISLRNPSFEGPPKSGDTPPGWKNCGFKGQTPPDVQPCNAFGVTSEAADGDTYLGMVVRDNDTWEKVGAKLSSKLEAGMVYEFKIRLCRSENYESASSLTYEPANYTTPVVLRIFGGHKYCDKAQLLGVSPPIAHTEWGAYRFTLSPTEAYSHILLEAYYADRHGEAYSGNILVDQASDFIYLGPSDKIDRASTLGERVRE